MVYGTLKYNELVTGFYKPTNITMGPQSTTNPIWLVVEDNSSENYEKSSIGMSFPFPTEWENIKFMFQSPPTSW